MSEFTMEIYQPNTTSTTLLLADRPEVITSFKGALDKTSDLLVAKTTDQAISFLNESEIEVIIFYPKCSTSTGIHFFDQIISDYPDPIRILITNKENLDYVIDAINKGRIYKYILKPWDDAQIAMLISDAIKLYYLRTDLDRQVNEYSDQLIQAEINLESLVQDIKGSNEISTNLKFDLITRLNSTISLLGIPD